jgi:hypothetical protein
LERVQQRQKGIKKKRGKERLAKTTRREKKEKEIVKYRYRKLDRKIERKQKTGRNKTE